MSDDGAELAMQTDGLEQELDETEGGVEEEAARKTKEIQRSFEDEDEEDEEERADYDDDDDEEEDDEEEDDEELDSGRPKKKSKVGAKYEHFSRWVLNNISYLAPA